MRTRRHEDKINGKKKTFDDQIKPKELRRACCRPLYSQLK